VWWCGSKALQSARRSNERSASVEPILQHCEKGASEAYFFLRIDQVISERPQPEWLDLKELRRHACVSERTLREWIHRAVDPLPAVSVGRKILVRRSVFDRWLEAHEVKHIDLGCIVDELVASVKGTE
jgi:excisionase family DNA binding protein